MENVHTLNKHTDGNPSIWIPETICIELVSAASEFLPYETGGVLMGYTALNGDHVVNNIIDAGPKAVHNKNSFEPDQEYQLNMIRDIYINSKREITYLGDWHSHPNSSPNLSIKDQITLRNIATDPNSQTLKPIMLILGCKPKIWTFNSVEFISQKVEWWSFSKCKYAYLKHSFF